MDKSEPARDANAGEQLSKLVWQPLLAHLKGVKTVVVAPDGDVGRFPWAALPGAKPGSFLLEDYAFAIVPVPQLLPELLAQPRPGQRPDASLLLLGDVDFSRQKRADVVQVAAGPRAAVLGKDGIRFRPLPGTRLEMDAIAKRFRHSHPQGTVTQLEGGAATEAAVRAGSPGRRYLHLATHGYFAPPSVKSALDRTLRDLDFRPQRSAERHTLAGHHPGLLSGLALAGANAGAAAPTGNGQPGDDGILTALEVAELDLRGVELVVLSACETGLGKTAGGEGLLGLQQAFQVAGARTLVASLWKVDDAATSVLMDEFYANLWSKQGTSPLESLRQAQLTVLKEPQRVRQRVKELAAERKRRGIDVDEPELLHIPGGKTADRSPPAWWAAFVLSGDCRR